MSNVSYKGRAPVAHHIDRAMAPGGGLILAALVSLIVWAVIAGMIAAF